jgi:hypothetical protein
MPQYYHLDRAKLSMRELRQISRSLRAYLSAVLLKCGLIPTFSRHPLVRPESIHRLPFDQFPIEARQELQPAIDEAAAAGLRLQFCYRTLPKNEFDPADTALQIAFLSEDQRLWGVLAWVRVQRSHVVRQLSAFQCRSLLNTGETLTTVNQPPRFDPPAHLAIERMVGGSPRAIVELHLRRLQAVPPDRIVRVPPDELENLLTRQAQELLNELLRRGLLKPLPDCP